MRPLPDKATVITAILEALHQDFQSYVAASKKTRSAGNDAQTKAEGKYDTRSIEENYLADGQAKHALLARQTLAAIEALPRVSFQATTPISLGALVQVAFEKEKQWFFIAPAGGGLEIDVHGVIVTVLSLDSPLGVKLKGCTQGTVIAQPAAKILRVL